ncbi:uncharacterized protein LACBIDRAFT_330416 [Laccaria bicolor S238N-H82]|uniref:Predicted protein n=1 Tax=Laccaria bicolor (strain S238N-H82 / ATCC MYA-4686) TaxID=486041 RepID=B0DL84_LACBS|nr:uncharacterized protein LACBIDRAFT_330416 [Laccaria bicolor S238N-H82]EDR04518.1 predicted protein [Laccaria bicolor S238N-H82]|eukprot:XP_001884690.1 predicted protein [Laccaria bicolor S238N-H82]
MFPFSQGSKVEDLTDRLAKHERESIDSLAEAAGVEAKLMLSPMRAEGQEGLSKLLASQEVINAKDKEIISLKAEVKALGESKAELRALVAEAKKAVAEKDRELRARDSNILFEQKVEDLNSQVDSAEASLKVTREWLALAESEARERKEESDILKTKVESLEVAWTKWEGLNSKLQTQIHELSTKEGLAVRTTQLVQAEIKRVTAEAKKASFAKRIKWLDEQDAAIVAGNDINNALQNKLDEQTAALSLVKDQSTANEAGVQEIVHNLRTELAVVHEQKLALERETANLKASFNQLTRESAASLASAQVDFEKRMNQQEKANEHLVSAQEKRTVAAEKVATLAENDAKEARVAREELADRLTEGPGESHYSSSANIIKHYPSNANEDLVAQENELRRVSVTCERLATGLHSRIQSLDAALVQMLQERAKSAGPDAKTLLNFRIPKQLEQEEMIKPPSPISKPQPRATNQKKKSFKALEDANSDYEYDNRDNDLNDLSDLELSSPTGRSMRKRGSFYITATYCDRRGACGDKTKLGMHVPLLRYSPAVFQPHFSGSSESGCRYDAYHPVPAGRSFGFDFPSKVPDGPAKTCQKKCKWLVRSHYQCPVVRSFCVAWDSVFLIRLVFPCMLWHLSRVLLLGNCKYLLLG